ncbi:hypothetical protein N7529_012055 [Neofusicoccum parvum]|uniref:Uncharacterized protein n=1 Tax=Neofusicoccum parvum TaxID=310453 RepID=A0ACB5SKS0_9PEZI|nr:hypothetical protein N7529_012055 [Neofusicoccum parvum]
MEEKRTEERLELAPAASNLTSTASNADHKETLIQSIRRWPRVTLYCCVLASAILLFGYDLVIVGTVSAMPRFQAEFGQQFNGAPIIPSLWLSLWTASSPIGAMLGAWTAGAFQDMRGRRASLALGSVLSTLAVGLCFAADAPSGVNERRAVFLAGKLLQGYAVGAALCTTQTYMSEVLPPALRGPLLAFLPAFALLGQLAGAAVVDACLELPGRAGYRAAFASQWALAAAPVVAAAVVPESPAWLVRGRRVAAARRQHRRLYGGDAAAAFAELRDAIAHEEEGSGGAATYAQCFGDVEARRTALVAFANLLPEFFGFSLLGNATYFVQTIGMAPRASVTFLMLGIGLGLLANVASFWTLSRVGRRPLMLWTVAAAAVLWASIGVAGCFDGEPMIWYTAVCMMVIVMTVGVGAWPASYVVGAETSSIRLRAKAQGIGWFASSLASAVMGFLLPYVYNPDQGALGSKTGFIFAALSCVAFVIVWLYVPEMKDRKALEIDRMFELQLPARRFKRWSCETVDLCA